MNTPELEVFLARVYTDVDVRTRFLRDPAGEAMRAGLTEEQCRALAGVDRTGVEMAARSFGRKRTLKQQRARGPFQAMACFVSKVRWFAYKRS